MGRSASASLFISLLLVSQAAAAPTVEILPVRILDHRARPISIAVQFPEGLASITGVAANFNGIPVVEFLLQFITELTAVSARIDIPPLAFPAGTEGLFEFSLQTTAGSAQDTLQIAVPPPGAVIGYSVRSDADDRLYRIDLLSGAATMIGPVGSQDVEGLSFDPNGVLYGVDDEGQRLITIDLDTGAGMVIANIATSVEDIGLAFDGAGVCWLTSSEPRANLYSVNPQTAALTLEDFLPKAVNGLAAENGFLYGLAVNGSTTILRIEPAGGSVITLGSLSLPDVDDGGLDFDAAGTLWGIEEDGGKIFTIDTATGRGTLRATTLTDFEGLAIVPPLPASR